MAHLVRVRWRKALGVALSKAAWVQMAPTQPRNIAGAKTAAQAMVLPGQTQAEKCNMLRESREISDYFRGQ